MFVTNSTMPNIKKVFQQNNFIKRLVCIGLPSALFSTEAESFEEFTKTATSSSFKCVPLNIYENIALILYSSGTTGQAKGVQLTQGNIIAAITKY